MNDKLYLNKTQNNFRSWNFPPKLKLKYSKSAIENAITNKISLEFIAKQKKKMQTTNYSRYFSNCIVKLGKIPLAIIKFPLTIVESMERAGRGKFFHSWSIRDVF